MKNYEVTRNVRRVIREVQIAEVRAENREEAYKRALELADWEWSCEEDIDDYIDLADGYEVIDWDEDE